MRAEHQEDQSYFIVQENTLEDFFLAFLCHTTSFFTQLHIVYKFSDDNRPYNNNFKTSCAQTMPHFLDLNYQKDHLKVDHFYKNCFYYLTYHSKKKRRCCFLRVQLTPITDKKPVNVLMLNYYFQHMQCTITER